jgi:hypothetical protein
MDTASRQRARRARRGGRPHSRTGGEQ